MPRDRIGDEAADDIERAIDEARYFEDFTSRLESAIRAEGVALIEHLARELAEKPLRLLLETWADMKRNGEPTVAIDRAIQIKTGRAS